MNKLVTVAVLGAALMVAGCGKSDEAAKAGGDTAASGTAATGTGDAPVPATGAVKREAGNWKTDIKLVKFDMPGMPAAAKDQMSKQFEAQSGTEQCLTQAQVDQENISEALSKGYGEACSWSKNAVGGGKLDVAGTCTANGQKVDLAMLGTLDPRKTDMLITSKGPAPTGGQMEVQMQVTSTHIGPCKS